MGNIAVSDNQIIEAGEASQTTPINLLQVAIQNKVDSQQLKELMDLEREWRADKAKAAYSAAMAKFNQIKRVIPHNKRGKTAGNAPFSYADYGKLVDAVTPWLADCDLSFSHRQDKPVLAENGSVAYVMVYCKILHKDGHSQETDSMAIPDSRLNGKVSPSQLIQLAVTYAKRQTLSTALGLATSEDAACDDGVDPSAYQERSGDIEGQFASAKSVQELVKIMNSLSPDEKKAFKDKFDIRRTELSGAQQ